MGSTTEIGTGTKTARDDQVGMDDQITANGAIDMDDNNAGATALRHRLRVLAVLDAALDRRVEVLQAIEDSEDVAGACRVIGSLLDTDEVGAQAVLNLQWHRLTRSDRARIAEEHAELRRQLAELP